MGYSPSEFLTARRTPQWPFGPGNSNPLWLIEGNEKEGGRTPAPVAIETPPAGLAMLSSHHGYMAAGLRVACRSNRAVRGPAACTKGELFFFDPRHVLAKPGGQKKCWGLWGLSHPGNTRSSKGACHVWFQQSDPYGQPQHLDHH